MNPFLFPWLMIPQIPSNCEKPPTVYSILESIVNYGTDDKKRIKDLAKYGRAKIFNFIYPLSGKVSREDFECQILNHYLMRRINFDTPTAFSIMLNTKLNEIMPKYNKLFDSLDYINFYDLTEKIGHVSEDIVGETTKTQELTQSNNAQTNMNSISDRRNSELPQSELENLRDGSYVSDYNYDTNTSNSTDKSTANSTQNGTDTNSNNRENNYTETIKHTPADVIRLYEEYQENVEHIYSLIYKDLDCLFYGLE